MRLAGLVRRKQDACRECEPGDTHRHGRDLEVVHDANERWLSVIGKDDQIAEDDVLKVHVSGNRRVPAYRGRMGTGKERRERSG
jgi:hypothetical protein